MRTTYTYATTEIVLRDALAGQEIWVGHHSPPTPAPALPPEVAHHLPHGAICFNHWGDFTAWLVENRVVVTNCFRVVEPRPNESLRSANVKIAAAFAAFSDLDQRAADDGPQAAFDARDGVALNAAAHPADRPRRQLIEIFEDMGVAGAHGALADRVLAALAEPDISEEALEFAEVEIEVRDQHERDEIQGKQIRHASDNFIAAVTFAVASGLYVEVFGLDGGSWTSGAGQEMEIGIHVHRDF